MFCHMLKLKDVKNANIESLKNASIHVRKQRTLECDRNRQF